MTLMARRRQLRVVSACCSAIALAVGLVVAMSVAGGAPHAAANPTGASPTVYVTGSGGQVDGFALSALTAGNASPIHTPAPGGGLGPVALNVNATRVLVGAAATETASSGVYVLNATSGAVLTQIALPCTPLGIAADPNNANIAYVLENARCFMPRIYEINISTSAVTGISADFGKQLVTSIAVSPDSATLYVGGQIGEAYVIDSVPISDPAGGVSWSVLRSQGRVVDIAVTPDGSHLVAAVAPIGESEGFAFSLPLPLVAGESAAWQQALTCGTASPIQLCVPTTLTVSPDGNTMYVGGNDGPSSGSAVQAFDAHSGNPTANASVPMTTDGNGASGLRGIAVSPANAHLFAFGVNIIPTAASTTLLYSLTTPGLTGGQASILPDFGIGTGPQDIAITPDQAPVAHVAAPSPVQVGHSINLDASASTVAYGSVNTFAWNFGDGNTGAGVSTSHTYSAPGTYTVTVTETDSAGTSIPPAVPGTGFTVNGPGQTPFRRADPSARTSVAVVVTAAPPPPTTPTTTHTTTTKPTTTTTHPTTTTTKPGQHKPGTPALILNPGLGPPGTIVTVTGTGFAPNTPVTVAWSVSSGSVVITADAHGNLPPRQLVLLTPDVLGPRFAEASSTPQATAPFLVVPGSDEPGGDDASLLFRSEDD